MERMVYMRQKERLKKNNNKKKHSFLVGCGGEGLRTDENKIPAI